MGVCFGDVARGLSAYAPLALQESYDNSGLQVGEPETEVRGVLVCLDVSYAVVAEALAKGCNLIVSHHPLIFRGLKSLTGQDVTSRIVMECLRRGIGLLAAHTNLDSCLGGVSYALGESLGLENMRALCPRPRSLEKLVTFCPPDCVEAVRKALFAAGAGRIGKYRECSFGTLGVGTYLPTAGSRPFIGQVESSCETEEVRVETVFASHRRGAVLTALRAAHPYEEVAYDIYCLENTEPYEGLGCVGTLGEAMSEMDFLSRVQEVCGAEVLRHSSLTGRRVERVALCGGSGAEFIGAALRSGADAYVTGDVKYHDFQRPEGGLLLVDAGHRETEMVAVGLLDKIIRNNFITFAVQKSECDVSPVGYYHK